MEPVSSSEEGSSMDKPTWVSWFCMLHNHEFFCEVDPSFLQDRFNLYGLKEVGTRSHKTPISHALRARVHTRTCTLARAHAHARARAHAAQHSQVARMLQHAYSDFAGCWTSVQ